MSHTIGSAQYAAMYLWCRSRVRFELGFSGRSCLLASTGYLGCLFCDRLRSVHLPQIVLIERGQYASSALRHLCIEAKLQLCWRNITNFDARFSYRWICSQTASTTPSHLSLLTFSRVWKANFLSSTSCSRSWWLGESLRLTCMDIQWLAGCWTPYFRRWCFSISTTITTRVWIFWAGTVCNINSCRVYFMRIYRLCGT